MLTTTALFLEIEEEAQDQCQNGRNGVGGAVAAARVTFAVPHADMVGAGPVEAHPTILVGHSDVAAIPDVPVLFVHCNAKKI